MRKAVFGILLVIIPSLCVNAQFKLTPNGFRYENDLSRDFVVFHIEGVSQQVLFNNTLSYLTRVYASAPNAISSHRNEVITINAWRPRLIRGIVSVNYDLRYIMVISFRDGRIRIDTPYFNATNYAFSKPRRLTMSGANLGFGEYVTTGLFRRNGRPNQTRAIGQLEHFFNTWSNAVAEAAGGKINQEEW